jgi:hypothetical protein
MTVRELIDLIADLPDSALDMPVLIPGVDRWATIKWVQFDDDRVILHLDTF